VTRTETAPEAYKCPVLSKSNRYRKMLIILLTFRNADKDEYGRVRGVI
jgi:hypothetical protein